MKPRSAYCLSKTTVCFGRTAAGRKAPSFLPTSLAIRSLSKAFIRRIVSLYLSRSKARLCSSSGSSLRSKQLDVVVPEDLIERLRSVERGGGIVTRELVASIEHKGQESALAEVGVHLGERRQRLAAEHVLIGCKQIVSV